MTEGPTLFDQEPAPVTEPEPFDPHAIGEQAAAANARLTPDVAYATGIDRAQRIVEGRGQDLRAEQTGIPSDDSPVVGPSAARAILRSKGPRREPTIGDQVIEHSKQRLKEGQS